jgi:hypothetical protein
MLFDLQGHGRELHMRYRTWMSNPLCDTKGKMNEKERRKKMINHIEKLE